MEITKGDRVHYKNDVLLNTSEANGTVIQVATQYGNVHGYEYQIRWDNGETSWYDRTEFVRKKMTKFEVRQSRAAINSLLNNLAAKATDKDDRKAALDAIIELNSILDYEEGMMEERNA